MVKCLRYLALDCLLLRILGNVMYDILGGRQINGTNGRNEGKVRLYGLRTSRNGDHRRDVEAIQQRSFHTGPGTSKYKIGNIKELTRRTSHIRYRKTRSIRKKETHRGIAIYIEQDRQG